MARASPCCVAHPDMAIRQFRALPIAAIPVPLCHAIHHNFARLLSQIRSLSSEYTSSRLIKTQQSRSRSVMSSHRTRHDIQDTANQIFNICINLLLDSILTRHFIQNTGSQPLFRFSMYHQSNTSASFTMGNITIICLRKETLN